MRWFAEELPELPVIAAGSLLEFTLKQHSFSMPVGRIQYLHLEPMSFAEFLQAGNKRFLKLIKNVHLNNFHETIPQILHQEIMTLFKEYLIIGGMPAAVWSWINERSFIQVNQIHYNLLATYREDFAKYQTYLSIEILDKVFLSIPNLLGQKYVYRHVDKNINSQAIKKALHLLNKSRVSQRVTCTSANGVPLGAQVKENYFKQIFLDVGLVNTALGLKLNQLSTIHEINLVNQGAVCEQVVGQLLKTIIPPYVEPHLYYWLREEKGASAEVDYIIEQGTQIIPIEVKSGSSGSLKSLHLLMDLKKLPLAIRINSDLASSTEIDIKNQIGNKVRYQLLSLPFYLISEIPRFLEEYEMSQDKC